MPKEFYFVVKTNDPNNDESSTADKLFVRTVAATRSWSAHRDKIAAQSHGLDGGYRVFVAKLSKPKQEQTSLQKQNILSSTLPVESKYNADGSESIVGPVDKSQWRYNPLPEPYIIHAGTPCPCAQCRGGFTRPNEVTIGNKTTTIPIFAPRQGLDPFNCYPIPREAWFDQVLHHCTSLSPFEMLVQLAPLYQSISDLTADMLQVLTVYGPRGWSALEMTLAQGLAWEWTLNQLALSEPALFYVRLLTGSYDLVKLGALRADIMYWLHDHAIHAINEAIQDPKRACSEAMILAVGRIALCEYMHGSREAAVKIHRPAQKRMVEMRGGLEKLNLPSLVVRLVRWSDTVMAGGDLSRRCFKDDEKNPNFTLNQSLGAMERWKSCE